MSVKDLLCVKVKSGFPQAYIKSVLANIVQTIKEIAGEWQEDIPLINAFVFKKGGKCSSFIRKKVFGDKSKHSTQQQISEHAARIAAYPKWDEVLEVFRKKAFEISQP